VPAEQTVPPGQTVPQAPQLVLLLLRLVSQPLATMASQLPKPALQLAMVHALLAQPLTALASAQMLLQAPQLVGLVRVLISQPSLSAPLQLPKPVEQAMPHSPEVQLAVPLVPTHARPHAPQLVVVVMFTSHTSPGMPLQSAVPAAQLTLEVPQVEAAHTATLPTGGVGQRVVQAPQLLMSPAVTLTSQPSTDDPLQSRKPAAHAPMVQRPAAQVAAALANWQLLPHTPQLVTVVLVLTSQPLLALPSQLPKPALHAARVHALDAQPATPLARVHTVPHAPQLLGSLARSRQTPEQLTVGDAQVAEHMPPEQICPDAHITPQPPQLLLSVAVARQVPEQLV